MQKIPIRTNESIYQNQPDRYIGLSTATKPTGVPVGTEFFEYDLQRTFVTPDGGTTWTLKQPSLLPTAKTTVDLNNGGGEETTDLFTAASDITILELTIIIPADLTGTAAGDLTELSIHDDSAGVLISTTQGAKANLTEGAHIQFQGSHALSEGDKIQITYDNQTTAEQICLVYMTYAGVV